MYVLGISCFRDDATAALLKDGAIVGIAEEERARRVKHAIYEPSGVFVTSQDESEALRDFEVRFFPTNSIAFLLTEAGINPTDIDYVAYDFDHRLRAERFAEYRPASTLLGPEQRQNLIACWHYWQELLVEFAEECEAELVYVPHHLAHASGTVFGSGYDQTNFMVIDALGELTSTTLGKFDGDFHILRSVPLPHSLGLAYAAVTRFLGFRPFSDEQKTMGLSGYGEDRYRTHLEKMVWITAGGFETDPDLIWTDDVKMEVARPSMLNQLFGVRPRSPEESALSGEYPHIACSLQRQLERVVHHLFDILYAASPESHLCLGGGVALNCQMNGQIAQLPVVQSLFIQPQAGDAGTALGAAYYTHFRLTGQRPEPFQHAYQGPCYSTMTIRALLDRLKLSYRCPTDITDEAARLLQQGKIVGWFQGRSECGPRALGNRSILANPSIEGIDAAINRCVKDRETWRPFAAAILDEDRASYLAADLPSPYMLLSLPLTERGRRDLVAASHIDGTTRPQTVERSTNTRFHQLLVDFKRRTGIGGLLNTSFNTKSEPIVDSPAHALHDYYLTELDALVLEDCLLIKEPLAGT